ncbi:MAG: hypothetical protein QOJ92_210 [Frankiales bacterium]|nr:hypothetical protein [Frankiales bacterium]
MTSLKLCGGTLPIDEAEPLLLRYLDPAGGYAWPSYDTLVTNGSVELVGSDLVAPVLLGAHIDVPRYRLLFDLLPELAAVATLPPVGLQGATDDDIDAVAALFAVVDREAYRRKGVKGTILSKVLHRKRPDLVPLYDSRIYAAYTAEGAIHRDAHREWREFMAILLRHMRADLQAEAAALGELQDVARRERGAELTPLRILDILVWMSLDDV